MASNNLNLNGTGTGDGDGDSTVWLWVGAAVIILIAAGVGVYLANRPEDPEDKVSPRPAVKAPRPPPPPAKKPAAAVPKKPAAAVPKKPAAPKPGGKSVQPENIVRDCVASGRIPDERPGRDGFCRCAPDKKWSATEKACVFRGIGAEPCGAQASVTAKTGGRAMRAFEFYGWGLRKGQCCAKNNNKLCKTPEEWVTATDVPGKALGETEDAAAAPVAANEPEPTASVKAPKAKKTPKASKPAKPPAKPSAKPAAAAKPPANPAAATAATAGWPDRNRVPPTAAAVQPTTTGGRTCSAGKVDNGTKCIDGPTLCAGKGKVWSGSKCVTDKTGGGDAGGGGGGGTSGGSVAGPWKPDGKGTVMTVYTFQDNTPNNSVESSSGRPLRPYRSVAVPFRHLKEFGGNLEYGQNFQIKYLIGKKMPNGTTHNGWVALDDFCGDNKDDSYCYQDCSLGKDACANIDLFIGDFTKSMTCKGGPAGGGTEETEVVTGTAPPGALDVDYGVPASNSNKKCDFNAAKRDQPCYGLQKTC